MTTPNFSPIVRVEAIPPWWTFPQRPVPTSNRALVLIQNGRVDKALTISSQPLSWREWSSYQSVVWVDINEQLLPIECQLPTKSLGLDFQVHASIIYKVNDPLEVVRWQLTNPRAQIETQVTQLMHEISRKYTMFECAAAETAIHDAILNNLASGDVVVTRCIITLEVEPEERDYARKERAAERNYLYSIKDAAYRKEIDPLDAELNHNMITFYNNLAQPGYAQFLLLHLASNRDQVQLVLNALNQQRQLDRDHWLKMLDLLNKNNALEPSDWEALRKTVIERLMEAAYSDATNGSAPLLNVASVGGGGSPPSGGPTPVKPVGSGPSGGGPTAANPTISGAALSSASLAAQPTSTVTQPAQLPPLRERAVGDPSGPSKTP